jgi:hypothetical protein
MNALSNVPNTQTRAKSRRVREAGRRSITAAKRSRSATTVAMKYNREVNSAGCVTCVGDLTVSMPFTVVVQSVSSSGIPSGVMLKKFGAPAPSRCTIIARTYSSTKLALST